MIDTHAHLDACAAPDDVIERAATAGVTRIVAVGSGLASCRATLEIAARRDEVYAALGIHPHQAGDVNESIDELRRALAAPKAVAVGETGLDFFRDYAPRGRQVALFARHLELAESLDMPVVVHCRAAAAEAASALEGFAGRVIIHCFSEPALLDLALERGYYVSFAGNVTYPKAGELRLAAGRVASDRLLAETDTPYLSPQPVRGEPNEPAYVVHTVAALAAARGENAEALARRIDENAAAAFSLP